VSSLIPALCRSSSCESVSTFQITFRDFRTIQENALQILITPPNVLELDPIHCRGTEDREHPIGELLCPGQHPLQYPPCEHYYKRGRNYRKNHENPVVRSAILDSSRKIFFSHGCDPPVCCNPTRFCVGCIFKTIIYHHARQTKYNKVYLLRYTLTPNYVFPNLHRSQ